MVAIPMQKTRLETPQTLGVTSTVISPAIAKSMQFIPQAISSWPLGRTVGAMVDPNTPLPNYDDVLLLRDHIGGMWARLTRSMKDLFAAAADEKAREDDQRNLVVYISPHEDKMRVETELSALCDGRVSCSVERLTEFSSSREHHGLLYLPHPYVVPGGRFNEMYGWDSYFINRGLLLEQRYEMARWMVENQLYQVQHYGAVLNANRTYYLTRSQQPFLAQMTVDLYLVMRDRDWLARALPTLIVDYQQWTRGPRFVESTGLSRYYDTQEGPADEVVVSERDSAGRTHYDRVKEYFSQYERSVVGRYYNDQTDTLTDSFYRGDRAMRESGFDVCHRFGPFCGDTHLFNPVCLNSLLYATERAISFLYAELGDIVESERWLWAATRRQQRINQYLWDEYSGMYLDYNFEEQGRRYYPFLTTFYPLWAGLASAPQARRVVDKLAIFECEGGLVSSMLQSGNQWDAVMGWAPLHFMAVEGLRRYGYHDDADRIAKRFLNVVLNHYRLTGTIVEKYDVVHGSGSTEQHVGFGYSSNEIGFGWTNGVALEFIKLLYPAALLR